MQPKCTKPKVDHTGHTVIVIYTLHNYLTLRFKQEFVKFSRSCLWSIAYVVSILDVGTIFERLIWATSLSHLRQISPNWVNLIHKKTINLGRQICNFHAFQKEYGLTTGYFPISDDQIRAKQSINIWSQNCETCALLRLGDNDYTVASRKS